MRSDGRSRPTRQIMENKILGTKNLPSAIWSKLNPPEWQTSKVVYRLVRWSTHALLCKPLYAIE